MCCSLKEKSLASSVKILVNDIEDLREAWDTLDTCFHRPEKYIAETLEPVVRFKGYKMFDNAAIREFYSLLRAAMMGARKAGLLHRLINDQTLPSIFVKMPANDWRQWAKERPTWMREAIEEAFWGFVDQKWRDALNVAAAEPAGWVTGSGRAAAHDSDKRGPAEAAKRLAHAAIHVAAAEEKPQQNGEEGRRCIFADVLGCTGRYPPWKCGRFGNMRAKEREKIIEDNRLGAFCLLHNRALPCRVKEKQNRPACGVPECKGRHIMRLHKFLKDTYGGRSQVHLVQGDDGWKEPEGVWVMGDEEEENEVMLVNTVQQERGNWQEADNSWLELNGGETGGVYCIGACHGERGLAPGTVEGRPHETIYLPEDEGAVKAGWWTPTQRNCQLARRRQSTSLISSGGVPVPREMEPSQHRRQRPQARQATRSGEREQQGERANLRERFGRTGCPWAKSPKRGHSRSKRRATWGPPGRGRLEPARDREQGRRTRAADGSSGDGVPGGPMVTRRKGHPTPSVIQGQRARTMQAWGK